MEIVLDSVVRPQLEYSCTVWQPHAKMDKVELDKVQNRAARYVTNCYHDRSSVSNMIEHLNWESLELASTVQTVSNDCVTVTTL